MNKLFLFVIAAMAVMETSAAMLRSKTGTFIFNDKTGAIQQITAAAGSHPTVMSGAENMYQIFSKSAGDSTGYEKYDRVVSKTSGENSLTYICTNPKLPGITIEKIYRIENNGLRRTMTFKNSGKVKRYITPSTECKFPKNYKKGLWHLGAGYIGPYKPLPEVTAPTPVQQYRQSSKGMVLIHPDGKKSNFSHYRVKINETVVLPWWHSTIGHYREYHDRLYYMPDGYRMGLGTLDIPAGGSISITDCFNCFDGNLFTFFDKVFGKDEEVMKTIRAIPPGPSWLENTFAVLDPGVVVHLRYMGDMIDEANFIILPSVLNAWGDYRFENGLASYHGGHLTEAEVIDYLKTLKISSRFNPIYYSAVIAAQKNAPVLKEHPEWFRKFDRSGKVDSLFPGITTNYQTMFNYPECRDFLVRMLMDFSDKTNSNGIYLDESQMTNTIDFQRDTVTRDDHTVKFWIQLKEKASKAGKLLFFNGSGIPYADLNYMESPHEMAPHRWRDWVGVAYGIGMMNRYRPGNRTVPLFWLPSNDFVNRILSLGWISSEYIAYATLPPMRASYLNGNLHPFDLKYSPDWKKDFSIEVESHAMQRYGTDDILLSFISRAAKSADIPVEIDLSSLKWNKNERINIYKINLRYDSSSDRAYVLSDRELKENYRKYQWFDGGTITKPELIYSGNAEGIFKDMIKSPGSNKMVQYLIVKGPAGVFSVDDQVMNHFYTLHRQGRVKGNRISFKRNAEILLIDKDFEFRSVSLNGKNVVCKPYDIGGVSGVIVPVPAGNHTLSYKRVPRGNMSDAKPEVKVQGNTINVSGNRPVAIVRDGATIYVGNAPVRIPEKHVNGTYQIRFAGERNVAEFTLSNGRGSDVKPMTYRFSEPQKTVKSVNVKHGNVTVSKTALFLDRFEDVTGMQRNILPGVTVADPEKLILKAGSTRRQGGNHYLVTYAGMEFSNARQVRLKVDNTFASEIHDGAKPRLSGLSSDHLNFIGLVLDYSVDGKYSKRVTLSLGGYVPKFNTGNPPWGAEKAPDMHLELAEVIAVPESKVFSLDLTKFAPKKWDGKVFLSLGVTRVLPNRNITVKILDFNRKDAKDFLEPNLPLVAGKRVVPKPSTSKRLKTKPASLKEINQKEWNSWAVMDRLQLLGTRQDVVLYGKTKAFLAHDYEYVYLAAIASEPGRPPIINSSSEVVRNERLEFMIQRPDNKVYQVLADPNGNVSLYIGGRQADPSDIIAKGKIVPGVGYMIFIAIPVDVLKFNMQRTPVIVKANVCRVRMGQAPELTAWAPLRKTFSEVTNYGTWILHYE